MLLYSGRPTPPKRPASSLSIAHRSTSPYSLDSILLQYANTTLRYTEDDAPAKQEPVPEVKIETAPAIEVNAEELATPTENANADGQIHGDDQDVDDDIDFNLGNGNGYSAPANQQDAHGPGIKEDG